MGSGGLHNGGAILHNNCSDFDYNYSDSEYGYGISIEPDRMFVGDLKYFEWIDNPIGTVIKGSESVYGLPECSVAGRREVCGVRAVTIAFQPSRILGQRS